jgi:hypothetical protein
MQGCLCVRPSKMSVASECMSNKAHVSPIKVNGMLTLDRVKIELLSPRWLPHRYHVEWLHGSFYYIVGTGARMACWGRIQLPKGHARLSQGRTRLA